MDVEDLDARRRLLTGPLLATLAASWEHVTFSIDVTEAARRPGEPIAISWVDGPPAAAAVRTLAPGWVAADDDREGLPGRAGPHAYPVTLRRDMSPVASAAAIVELAAAGQLMAAVAAGARGFTDIVLRWASGRALPEDAAAVWPRAEVVADIAGNRAGADVFGWATWLVGEGRPVLTRVVPATFDPADSA